MTEDYQGNGSLPGGLDQAGMDGLLGALGIQDTKAPANPDANPASAAPSGNPVVNTDGTPIAGTEGTPADGTPADGNGGQPATPTTNPVPNPDDVKRNQAFAEMRAVNAQYKKFISQLMKGANFQGSEEQFIQHLTDVSYQQQAKNQNVGANPELLKRLDNLEQTNTQLVEAQNKQMFISNIDTLTKKFSLNQTEVREFIQKAIDEKIDLTIPGTNFVTLYQGLFFDKIKEKLIESERQTWIANNTKANAATNPDGKSGTKDPSPTNVNTMAEFESLLQTMNPKK